ncbi:hypothetical protein GS397_14980 [Sphingobium yanoikuyae]|uniref:Rho termination factor N-terminal domain-containing protein n=1 Tax=Sphingobium yanoikuyae TaxID=13690 RepID=A0A6P1GIF1_SPHYA|nr:hypothetical protein [Sphingobium yanoikuyae]QHD68218.1 hypothetical protein GS397_14980 [Sphingobium yanoikuyae]
MAATKDFICARAMTDNGRDYQRGDTIALGHADAINLIAIGAVTDPEGASSDDADDQSLGKMKVDELKALAFKEEIDLGDATKKDDIIVAIKRGREAKGA